MLCVFRHCELVAGFQFDVIGAEPHRLEMNIGECASPI